MKLAKPLLLCALLAGASLQANAACYTVYDQSNRVMYSGERPPVDMSLPIHETLPARFPGGHMIFDTATDCPSIAASRLAPVRGGTPLLTDASTARAMNVPHVQLAGGIALVRPENAVMRPGVTVMPATALALATPAEAPLRDTVITELRYPPMTVVESVARNPGDATRMMGAGPAPRR